MFLLYTSIAGGGNPCSLRVSSQGDRVTCSSRASSSGPVRGDAHAGGLRFKLKDISGESRTTVAVLYSGSVPDLFKVGRHIVVDGALRKGTFVAQPGSMITKCPSKYAPKQSGDSV